MATIDSVKLPDNSAYDLTDNYSGYQKQTLTAPITVDGTSETTVEGALGAVNDYADKIEGSMSNENLLDNGWFTVNQRGASSYSTAGYYTADRWYMPFGGLTVNISSSGATLIATGDTVLDQKFETDELKGKTVTLSIKHFDGTIEQGTVQFPSTAGTVPVVITGGELQAGVDTYGNCYFRIATLTGNTITARAVKLELGTVSTLANDVEPNYTTELLKCQRYFYRILSNSSSAFIAVGFMADSHTFYGTINLPVPMRGTPTSLFGGVLQIYTTGGTEDVSTLLINMRSPQILTIAATIGNSLTVNSPAILMGVANSYIDISADL